MARSNRSASQPTPRKEAPPAAPAPEANRPHHNKRLSAFLMLLTTGILLPLLFPPFYCFFLAPIALVPFAVCVIRRPLRWTYLLAYYALGIAFFLLNLYWLWPVTFGGCAALALYVGLYFPLFAIGLKRLVVHLRLPATFALPLTWTALEYIRSSFPWGGFPWFNLGNCLTPAPALIQTADLLGVWGLTFLICLWNGFIVDCLRLPLRQVQADGRARFSPLFGKLIATVTLLTALTTAYGVYRLGEKTTHAGPRVAVIQENIPQTIKDDPKSAVDLFMKHLRLTDEALAQTPRPDLVAWPETMVPAYINKELLRAMPDDFKTRSELRGDLEAAADRNDWSRRDDDIYEALRQETQRSGVPLLVGYTAVVPKSAQNASGMIQNRTALLLPDSSDLSGRQEYAKHHLVPFGEFIPLDNTPLGKWMLKLTPIDFDYSNTPGEKWTRFRLPVTDTWQETVLAPVGAPASSPATAATAPASAPAPMIEIHSETRFFTFATPICFEDTMPEPARQMTSPTAKDSNGRKTDFLVNVSNDGWFAPAELDQHLQACQIRAVEERVPMARSVNTGNSGFIDSNGRIVKLVTDSNGRSIGAVGTAAMELKLDSRVTLFSRIGDLLPIICGILLALLVGWTIARPRLGRKAVPGSEAGGT